MKVITNSATNVALYTFGDSDVVLAESNRIVIGEPPVLIIGDYSSSTATVYENVNVPDDWVGQKYMYNGSWSVNPDWVEPVEPALDENGMLIEGEPDA
jgi:hypothetical protein